MTAVTSPPQTFGSVVRERRQALRMSQQALADMLGVTQPSVARWESDSSFPKPPELSPLAMALDIPLEDLLAPLENLAKESRGSTRDQLDEMNDRLDRLENSVEALLKLLRRRTH